MLAFHTNTAGPLSSGTSCAAACQTGLESPVKEGPRAYNSSVHYRSHGRVRPRRGGCRASKPRERDDDVGRRGPEGGPLGSPDRPVGHHREKRHADERGGGKVLADLREVPEGTERTHRRSERGS